MEDEEEDSASALAAVSVVSHCASAKGLFTRVQSDFAVNDWWGRQQANLVEKKYYKVHTRFQSFCVQRFQLEKSF